MSNEGKKEGAAILNNRYACLFRDALSLKQIDMMIKRKPFMANKKVAVSSCDLEAAPSFFLLFIKFIKLKTRITMYKLILKILKTLYISKIIWDIIFGCESKRGHRQYFEKIGRGS